MNLHAVASPVVSAVNPMQTLMIQRSAGYATAADGTQVPTYRKAIYRQGQVQPLSSKDLRQIEGLNLQGDVRAVYIQGRIDGVVRIDSKGGDLITDLDGQVWLVNQPLEQWPDWCKVCVTRQNETQSTE